MIRQTLSSKAPLWVALTLLLTLSGCDEVVLFDPFTPDTFNQEFPTRVLVRPDDGSGGYEPPANADGKDWDTAFTDIQAAITFAAAHGIGEVWVAGGTYNLTETINPVEGVSLYGGFKVGDSFYDDRDPHRGGRTTTLSRNTNEYQIDFSANDISRQLIIDGFTFTGAGSLGINITGGASPTIRNCRFIQNVTSADGSTALYINGTGTTPLIENCSFSGFHTTGTPHMITCLSYCIAVFVDCYFTDNQADGSGGAIYIGTNARTPMIRCTFTDNQADIAGGAIYYASRAPLNLTDCTFTGNSATDNGGAIFLNADTTANLTRCTFTDNSATVNGGAIYSTLVASFTATLTDCIFTGNSADNYGGAIFVDNNNTYNIHTTRFTDNSAVYYGGAICCDEYSKATLTGCNLTGNYASGSLAYGGAIHTRENSDLTLRHCQFIQNGWNLTGGTPVVATQFGGAIYVYQGKITCTDSLFDNNASKEYGGAIQLQSSSQPREFERTNFINNNATIYGGAIWFWDCDGTNTLTDCNFTGNKIEGNDSTPVYGGGVAFTAQPGNAFTLTATRCTFSGNTVTNSGSGSAHGGGVYYAAPATVTLTNCTNGGNNNPDYYYSP